MTFDAEHPDRPSRRGIDDDVLDELERERVVATFFVQGRWAQAYPKTAARIVPAGHLVGNHSHFHARMPLLTDEGIAADVRDAELAIHGATGVDPKPWFRCPWGDGTTDPRVIAILRAAGYGSPIFWDVDSQDWDRDGSTVEECIVKGVLAHGDRAIVLLHTWTIGALEGLPGIVHRLRDAGALFVRLDEFDNAIGAVGPTTSQ